MECSSKIQHRPGEFTWIVDDSVIIAAGCSKLGEMLIRTIDGREYSMTKLSEFQKVTNMLEQRNKKHEIDGKKGYAKSLKS